MPNTVVFTPIYGVFTRISYCNGKHKFTTYHRIGADFAGG